MSMATTRRIALALRRRPESAKGHVCNAIQLVVNLLEFGASVEQDRKDLRAVLHRLWLALRELEKGGRRGESG